MFWINIKRVSKLGFVNFWRNGSVSLASILITTIALLVVATLILSRSLFSSTLTELQRKVDVNVYFTTSATEDEILVLKRRIESLPEVSSIEYSSREQELERFRERHEGDELILQSLDEIGENPLGAVLNIQAKNPSQYEGIASFIEGIRTESNASIIDNVNYNKNKTAIDSLSRIIEASKKLGTGFAIFAIAISILITFNTIRLTIYMAREEISVMRLVGASSRYIRGPFVFTGLMYGFFSTILAIVVLVPALYWAGPFTKNLGTGINVFEYFLSNLFSTVGTLLIFGLAIGSVSSYLAVKKYLKI